MKPIDSLADTGAMQTLTSSDWRIFGLGADEAMVLGLWFIGMGGVTLSHDSWAELLKPSVVIFTLVQLGGALLAVLTMRARKRGGTQSYSVEALQKAAERHKEA